MIDSVLYGNACDSLFSNDVTAFPAEVVSIDALQLNSDGSSPGESYQGSVAVVGANRSDCRSLMAGSLTTGGVHAGLRDFIRLASAAALRRLAANVPSAGASGLGLGVSPQVGSGSPGSNGLSLAMLPVVNGRVVGNMTSLAANGATLDSLLQSAAANGALPSWNFTAMPYSPVAELRSEAMRAMREIGQKYLVQGSSFVADQYAAAGA